ncbi:MAG: type I DNA topoisomerase [Candidatus Krumholzibacteria bacterium]|nr:type I DNA topoisomerase [Candidatus Krumholzibacteria bacterium]
MDQVLVVVESPAKARTIKKYLGKGYSVKASVGHIRDLPEREMGIAIEDGFAPKYVAVKGKAKIVTELRREAAKSVMILLATDMDREGEAIAWHLKEVLGKTKIPIRRIIFNEITQKAIQEAVASPRDIDLDKVNAQQARRILDRLFGYLISPVLWKIFYRGLSAGRVQSVGLRLICEREREIRAFVPAEYWTIEGMLATGRGEEFATKLLRIDGRKPEITGKSGADEILESIKRETLSVREVSEKEKLRNAQPPFITSTLQREAAGRLGFSAKKTMLIAQQLYEGVDLGSEGAVGLISYMRTDSTRLSAEAHAQGTAYLRETFGADMPATGRKVYKKTKGSQDAHEAIRPTDCYRTPDSMKQHLGKDQLSLYWLIWQRFLASLAAPAVYRVVEADIMAGDRYLMRSNGRTLVKPGFLAIMQDQKAEQDEMLPALAPGDPVAIRSLDASQHFTEPPPRYTEASLIKELEDKGIGRPSTYASILGVIQARDYVNKKASALFPTELGEKVWGTLESYFRDVFEVDFTARMEMELDKVEEGKDDWRAVVKLFYDPLTVDLDAIQGKGAELKKLVQEETKEICANCGKSLVKKWGKNGPFLACPGFPECRFTRPLEEVEAIDRKCPQCGGGLVHRTGRFGRFIACQKYPVCKYTEAVTLGIPCPTKGCSGQISEKRSRRGRLFYGCTMYPKCTFASWDKPTGQLCPSCSNANLVEKNSAKKGTYLKCPSCRHEVTS